MAISLADRRVIENGWNGIRSSLNTASFCLYNRGVICVKISRNSRIGAKKSLFGSRNGSKWLSPGKKLKWFFLELRVELQKTSGVQLMQNSIAHLFCSFTKRIWNKVFAKFANSRFFASRKNREMAHISSYASSYRKIVETIFVEHYMAHLLSLKC